MSSYRQLPELPVKHECTVGSAPLADTLAYASTPRGQIRCVIEGHNSWFSPPYTAGYSLHCSLGHTQTLHLVNYYDLLLSKHSGDHIL